MRIGFDYNLAISKLSSSISKRTLEQYKSIPTFKTASPLIYANDIEIADKAEMLLVSLAQHLKVIEPDKKLFFNNGDTIAVPDIHGDFVHLIITLHRHGLLDEKLSLKKDFTYVFLGDFYNHGKDSDIVDYWLNKQIANGAKIHRIAGNHELFFIARDKNGTLRVKLRHPITGQEISISANDLKRDAQNGYLLTEELLKSISDGTLLGAYTFLDVKNNVPRLYAHTFVTNNDFERAGIQNNEEVVSFVSSVNERFQSQGQEVYKRFIDSKQRDKFDFQEIAEPLFSDPLFNIFHRDENKRVDAFFMRVTGVNRNLKITSEIKDKLPYGIYQIVGHIRVPDFDLPQGQETNRPLILPSNSGRAFVQFTDVAIGQNYKENDLERPEVSIQP
ncbi:MAG: metallophosphoesterase [Candidatus Melainabacteria bacterium]|nr:metallophosphoesterase [Candidatus Melainabacteria bacterium]